MPDDKPRTAEKDLDPVRKLILDTIHEKAGASFSNVSLVISPSGRGASYLSDFVWYGHGDLPETVRHKLANHLGLPERDFRPPGALAEPGIGYDRPPPPVANAAPDAPYEARDLFADLVEALERLHREERLALGLHELGLAVWDMQQEIMAEPGDLRARLDAALRARRRWLRRRRTEILAQRDVAS